MRQGFLSEVGDEWEGGNKDGKGDWEGATIERNGWERMQSMQLENIGSGRHAENDAFGMPPAYRGRYNTAAF